MTLPLFIGGAMLLAALWQSSVFAQTSSQHRLYSSELAAVVAAANQYNPVSIQEDREYIGTIFRHGNRFGFTVTAGARGCGCSSISLPQSELMNVVAFWHTHGGISRAYRYFSSADTSLVNQHNKPLYLADYTGYLKVFRPGDHTLAPRISARLGLGVKPGIATGEFVRSELGPRVKIQVRQTEATTNDALSPIAESQKVHGLFATTRLTTSGKVNECTGCVGRLFGS